MSEKESPTIEEHESLKETLQSFVRSSDERFKGLSDAILNQGKEFHAEMTRQELLRRDDNKALHAAIGELGKGVYGRIDRVEGKRASDDHMRAQTQKPQWGVLISLLGLVFTVILALGAVAAWNMTRIEQGSNERHIRQGGEFRHDFGVLLADQNEKNNRNENEIDRLNASHLKMVADVARSDEKLNLLYDMTKTFPAVEGRSDILLMMLRDIDEKGSRKWIDSNKEPKQ